MRSAALALLVAAVLPAAASAAPVTVVMTGTWDYIDDPLGVVSGQIALGTSYTVTLTYDDATPDSNPAAIYGNYHFTGPLYGFTLTTASYTFVDAPGGTAELDTVNDSYDSLSVMGSGLTGGPGLPAFGTPSYITTSFDDSSATALSSTALLGLPWVLSSWETSGTGLFFDIADGNPNTYVDLGGTITSMTVIPEPTSFGLVAAGAVALAGAKRRRARAAA